MQYARSTTPAQTYVPELIGTEYGITPIRALLHMASGVQFGETYQPGSDILKLQAALLWPGAVGAPRALEPFNTRLVPPGTRLPKRGELMLPPAREAKLLGLDPLKAIRTGFPMVAEHRPASP